MQLEAIGVERLIAYMLLNDSSEFSVENRLLSWRKWGTRDQVGGYWCVLGGNDGGLVKEIGSWAKKKKKKFPIKFLELFSYYSLYLTTYKIGTQNYLMKAIIIHHIFIEHPNTGLVIGDLNF